ncbi:hypothetical protein ACQY0O_002314 [Thecaphora frezii]
MPPPQHQHQPHHPDRGLDAPPQPASETAGERAQPLSPAQPFDGDVANVANASNTAAADATLDSNRKPTNQQHAVSNHATPPSHHPQVTPTIPEVQTLQRH